FLFVQATEADVVIGFLTSPEFLYDHRADAALANVLNTDLLGGMATAAHLSDWNSRLGALDSQRATLQAQAFTRAEDYKAQLGAALNRYYQPFMYIHTGFNIERSGVVVDALAAD